MNKRIDKDFKNGGRYIQYLNKDFTQFRDNLIEFSKTYFPKTYADFNETSPGMLFIEMASYIGDVLSYYIDDTLKESLLPYADDVDNVISLSQFLGYTPKVTSPAVCRLSVYQLAPAIGYGQDNRPDPKYLLRIKDGMSIESVNGTSFITQDDVDFSDPTDRDITVYERDSVTSEPTLYLIKKYVDILSAEKREASFTFGNYAPFREISLPEFNVIDIYDIRDSNGNKYYHVPYLAQEMVYVDSPNDGISDPELAQFKETVPYILRTIKSPRRFTTRVNPNFTTSILFGSGNPGLSDEVIVPTFKNVGLGLRKSISKLEASFDPTNFLKTQSYGVSPSNTTITVKYLVGGGIQANSAKGEITRITGIEYREDLSLYSDIERSLYNQLKTTIAVDNEFPATGGRGADTLSEIRENSLANFSSQNRAVTSKDYKIRTLAMPSKYGSISKVFAVSDGSLDNNSPSSVLSSPTSLNEFTDLVLSFVQTPDAEELTREEIQTRLRSFLAGKANNLKEKNNPFAINLYLLGYNSTGKLAPLNLAVKENLKTYLGEFRMLTDGINILDGFIVNIGVDFEVITYKNYNKSEVLANCISELTEYFKIENWDFNDTVNISEIELILANVEGVNSVPSVIITNKCSDGYSPISYNIQAATRGKIVYPSLDPCVFELKYPNKDIRGRAK